MDDTHKIAAETCKWVEIHGFGPNGFLVEYARQCSVNDMPGPVPEFCPGCGKRVQEVPRG